MKTKNRKQSRVSKGFKGEGKTSASANLAVAVEHLMNKEEKTSHRLHMLEDKKLISMVGLHGQKRQNSTTSKPRSQKKESIKPVQLQPDGRDALSIVTFERSLPRPTGSNASDSLMGSIGLHSNVVLDAKLPWVNAVYNGVAPQDCRFPDPFTMTKTSLVQLSNSFTVTPSPIISGTTDYEFAVSGTFKGSGTATLAYHGAYAATPSVSSSIDWATYDGSHLYGMSYYDCGIDDQNLFTRPNGCVLTIQPQLRGLAHSVTVNAFPFAPILSTTMTSSMTGWPATLADFRRTPTSAQLSWGARSWNFNPGDDSIRLVTLPYDSRCLDFGVGNVERNGTTSSSICAWQGWAFWVYGLGPNDLVTITVNSVEEVMRRQVTATVYPYPSSIRPTSSLVKDNLVNTAVALANRGLTGFKLTTSIMEGIKSAGKWALGEAMRRLTVPALLGASPQSNFTAALQNASSMSLANEPEIVPCAPPSHVEEEKTEDQLEMVTPKSARRPSLALSLSARKK